MIKKQRNKKNIFTFIGALLLIVIALLTLSSILLKRGYDNQIKEIFIFSKPEKVEYFVNDEFTIDGLKVCVLQNDGDFYILENSDLVITGFDSSIVKTDQRITIEYQGFKTFFTITIKETTKPNPILVSIELERLPDKLVYKAGEWLDTKGGIILITYSDGSTAKSQLINNEVYKKVKDYSKNKSDLETYYNVGKLIIEAQGGE
jgi:hypothetical protein